MSDRIDRIPAGVESPTSPEHNKQSGRESDTGVALKLAMACHVVEHGESRAEQAKARQRARRYAREMARRYGI